MDNKVTQTSVSQSQMTAEKALEFLKEGNVRFIENKTLQRDLNQQVSETAGGQFPFAAIVSCIDSRIPTEVVFDQGIGDVFNARVAGNVVNEDILGSLEFACKLAGAKLVLVLGHTSCGAVKGACDNAKMGNLTTLLEKLKPAVNDVETPAGVERNSSNIDFVNKVADKNVELTIQNIKEQSSVLKELNDTGAIQIVGAMYDVKTGKVVFDS